MKIVDRKNKKRINKEDPVKKNPVKDEETKEKEYSPMDPPETNEIPGKVEEVPYEKMPTVIQQFMDEHQTAIKELEKFEEALTNFKKEKWVIDEEKSKAFQEFFSFLDDNILDHNQREEKILFELLHERLIEAGEHGQLNDREGRTRTSIDLMEDDHVKFIQYGSLVFNFLGLSEQLPDLKSQSMVADLAYSKGMELTEMLRLHIEREDTILFPQAYNLISKEEFEEMEEKMKEKEKGEEKEKNE
ncbi:MAG: hemerythrin domain-containing protein [Flavobacteriales bacterium]